LAGGESETHVRLSLGSVYVAIIHYPVYDRKRRPITTSIKGIDLHDISRTCKTYGVKAYYVVQPLDSQHMLAKKISEYWQDGPGGEFNPSRKEALELLRVTRTIEEMEQQITDAEGLEPVYVSTDGRSFPWSQPFKQVRENIRNSDRPFVILLGTGDGLDEAMLRETDIFLEPIQPKADFNHLSVRSAAAIILDRLLADDIE